MRRTAFPLFLLVTLAANASWVHAWPAGSAVKDKQEAPASVSRWLVLGPVADPLPIFHEEKRGGYGIEDTLKAERFPAGTWAPVEGRAEPWFAGGNLSWAPRQAGKDGLVALEAPAGSREGRPAVAWLGVYLQTDRWQAVELEVRGAHPRRAWLDAEAVAMGGISAESGKAEVKGTLKLGRGKHVLVIETLLDPSRKTTWSAGAALKPVGEGAKAEFTFSFDPERDLDLLDVLDAPEITSIAVAPDGGTVAATLRRVLPGADESETWVEARTTLDGTRTWAWRGGFDVSQVAWAPGGSRLSYVTQTKAKPEGSGKASGSLWLADLETKAVDPLLDRVEGLEGYAWSPDGRSILYWTSVTPEADKRGVKRLEGLLDRQAGFRTKSYLNLVTVPGGTRRRLTAGALSATAAAFSPDGLRLLFTRDVEDLSARPYSRTELWEMDLASFEAKRLRDSRGLRSAQYSPDGQRLLLLSGPSEFGKVGINVPEGLIPNEFDGELYLWSPATDDVQAITRDFDPAVQSATWSRADGQIYLTAGDRDFVRLFRYDAGSKAFTPIDTGLDVLDRLETAERAPVAVVTGTSPWAPQRLVSLDLRTGRTQVLDRPAQERLAHVRSGIVEAWDFTSERGARIHGRVYLPPGFDPARRYPAIVSYYGGTLPTEREFGGRYPREWWAAQGYVVYVLQPSGATGFGQAFSALHVNDWGDITSAEIVEGTRKFLEAHPYVDPKRVGCIGASFGGFMTERLVTQTDLYAAAVSHAGISSISSYWGEGYWGYAYSAQATAFSFPWNRKDIYVERSPLFHADKVKTPILLTHGASDTNVPAGESDTFYTALKLAGAPVEYVQVAGQDHWIVDHAKRVVWSRTILAWFDRWLKGEPGWWDDLHPAAK